MSEKNENPSLCITERFFFGDFPAAKSVIELDLHFFKKLNVSPRKVFLKAFVALLARYSGQSHFVFGYETQQVLCTVDLTQSFSKFLKKEFKVDESLESEFPTVSIAFDETSSFPSPLKLVCMLKPQKAILTFSCLEGHFSSGFVERMGKNLCHYLQELVSHAKDPMGKVSFVSKDECHLMLNQWNMTQKDYPKDLSLSDLFEQTASHFADHVAVKYLGETLTYQELNEKANQVAHHLVDLGVKKGDFVGISLERSSKLLVGILGILKTGAAYIPINSNYPSERKNFMIKDAGVKLVIDENFQFQHPNKINPDIQKSSDDVSMVYYTSGSTGVPKGVEVLHRGVTRIVKATGCEPVSPKDRVLHIADVSFDAASYEIWMTLLNGGQLCIYPSIDISVKELECFLRDHQVTHAIFTSRLFNLLIDHHSQPFDYLCMVMVVGDVMSPHHSQIFMRMHPKCELVNGYGPTENTILTTMYPLKNHDDIGFTIPIGKTIYNTQVYNLDPDLQPVPIGVQGELYTGGDGVAKGYLNRSDLTNERFIPNPFGPGRLYRTGDLVRYLPDGNIEFIGRVDNQVKIRGFRIELGEVQSVVVQYEKISDCLVVVYEDSPGNKHLAAYVIPQKNQKVSKEELRGFLSGRLPPHVVPQFYVFLTSFPLKANGKIDTLALPNPAESVQEEVVFEPPETECESTVAQTWKELFHLTQVSRLDHFFKLGGDSLSSAELISILQAKTGKEIPLSAIRDNPVLRDFAYWIEHSAQTISLDQLIVKRKTHTPSSVSFNQESLWISHKMNPGSKAYLESFVFKLEGEVKIECLNKALNLLIERHESLRTSFEEKDGEVYAHIHQTCKGAFHYEKVGAESEAFEIYQRLANQAIDLTKLPLFRFVVIEISLGEYICFLLVHHIVIDGWSTHILFCELETIYASIVGEEACSLPQLPIQYPDYALWQRDFVESGKMKKQLHYWKEKLTGSPELLELPWDNPRPSVFSEEGDFYFFCLSEEVKNIAMKVSKDLGVTLFEFLFTVFLAYLHRLSGKEDLIAFTPHANRGRNDVENLIGYFVQMVMVRPRFESELIFTDLLKQNTRELADSYRNVEAPLEKIVKTLNPSRNPSYHPVFQTGFSLETVSRKISLKGVKSTLLPWHLKSTKFDLYMAITSDEAFSESKAGFQGYINYSTDLFGKETIERFVNNFEVFLGAVCENPKASIDKLPVMTDQEFHKIVYEWNAREREYPRDTSLSDLFEQTVEEYAQNIAVQVLEERVTYRDLNARANQLARHLQKEGVQEGNVVAIFLDRSIDLIVCIVAILKVGGVYLPVNADYPDERKHFMLSDAEAKIILTTSEYKEKFSSEKLQIFCIDIEKGILEEYSTDNLGVTVNALDVSMLYYTSGSTGKPKGVEVFHRGVIRLVKNVDWIEITAEDRFLHISDVSFDAATFEIWGALLNGASVHVYPYREISIGQLEPILTSQKVTYAFLTARLFNLLVEHHTTPLKDLRYLLSVGEAMSPQHAKMALKDFPSCHIVNAYGPTENSVSAIAYDVKSEHEIASSVPIGFPITNSKAYVLDKNMQPVPIGVQGELYNGGDGVVKGYLNRPELTKERFLPNPFEAGKIYRTGDLARYLPSGNIEFLGRLDSQVKIRGYRIELGEIEATLALHDKIADSLALVREDTPDKIVAYVIPKKGLKLTENDLREFLASQLPDYMVPSFFMVLESFPLKPNGKVDQAALPAPGDVLIDRETFRVPKSPEEIMIAEIWSEVLNRSNIDVRDHFFRIGGDSLLAIQVLSLFRKRTGKEIPPSSMNQNPVLVDFAKWVQMYVEEEFSDRTILPKEVSVAPLSYNQESLWLMNQLNPDSKAYLHVELGRLEGEVDKALMRSALEILIERHAILRTTFEKSKGKPYQAIHPDGGEFFLEYEVSSEEKALNKLKEHFDEPLCFETLPLMKFVLIKISSKKYLYCFLIPHIIFDGWSLNLMYKEWEEVYNQLAIGADVTRPPLPIQYTDYVLWQRDFSKTEAFQDQVNFWGEKLTGAPELLELPCDYPRPADFSFVGATFSFKFSEELKSLVQAKIKELGVTPFQWFLTVFLVFLYRMSGKSDMVIGTPYLNRGFSNLDQLVGYFVQMLMIRPSYEQEQTFSELLQQTINELELAYQNAEVPFEMIVNQVNPTRYLGFNPIFQMGFAFEQKIHLPQLKELSITPLRWKSHSALFDLFLSLSEGKNEITGSVNYSSDLFKEATIERFVDHYLTLLREVCLNPNQPIETCPIMSSEEADLLVKEWNQTEREYPRGLSLPDLFEHVASEYPSKDAIAPGLSYQTLNERANQMGRFLQSLGVQKGALVGICLDRSIDLIVAILGVLKIGATYVPINAGYPEKRKQLMLKDAGHLLTTTKYQKGFSFCSCKVVMVDDEKPSLEELPTDNLEVEIDPLDIALIHYTSGSTGVPKGVEIRHRNIVRLIKNNDWIAISPTDHVVHLADISFDASSFEIWGALLNGSTLHLYPSKEIAVEELEIFLQEQQITHAILTARLFNLFVEHLSMPLGHLRFLASGGEAMSVQHAQMACEKLPNCLVVNAYGPTENGVATTTCIVNHLDEVSTSIPIGRPISNTQVYILDRNKVPVPIGVQGELYVGGDGLANGYHNLPEANQEKFIPNPFGPGILYRTGDMVRYLVDGNIEYLGRFDTQVKISGYRIELGEIEETLKKNEKVADCFVIAREVAAGNKQIIAYVTEKQNKTITEEELKKTVCSSLPSYMEPSFYLVLDAFPLKSNGKIDKDAFPTPDEMVRKTVDFEPPQTPLETMIADIWSTILHLKKVGRKDSFFKIGGHSIEAAELASHMSRAFDLKVSMGLVMESSTLEEYSRRIQKMIDLGEKTQKAPITTAELFWIWKNREARLSPDIAPSSNSSPSEEQYRSPKKIFLTGATGFVGSFMLRELLDQTDADIFCLVRAGSKAEAGKRLETAAKEYKTWNPSDRNRIFPLAGDLEKPLLGLASTLFDTLGKEIDVIYHMGAYVNHSLPYHRLKKANVSGTAEALRLACAMRTKPFHLVSTVSVFDLAGGVTIYEDQDINESKALFNGYAQSKWVSEKLAHIARLRGLPVNVFRLGRIGGHSISGEGNAKDFLWRMAEASLFLNLAPDIALKENITPVDYTCQAIRAIASNPASINGQYHVLNPQLFAYREIYKIFQSLGYELTFVSYDEWKKNLVERALDTTDHRLKAVLPLFSEIELTSKGEDIIFLSDNTQQALKGSGISCPEIDKHLIEKYVDTFVKRGILPKKKLKKDSDAG